MITTQEDARLIVLVVTQDIHAQVVILPPPLSVFKFAEMVSKQFLKNVMTPIQITMMDVLLYV